MSETASPALTGKMFLFEQPELLNREQHGALGLDPAKRPFAFCSKIRAVPLTISEMPEAAKHYPVVFNTLDNPLPIAIVGLNSDFNLFVDDDGNWEGVAYVPGYLRRYPFGIATENNSDRFAMVFDRAYEGVSEKAERKLFSGDELSEFSKGAMEFTRTYEADRRTTEQAMNALKKFDIIKGQSAQFNAPSTGATHTFAQYFGFEEARVRDLTDEQFLELRRMNLLPIIYSQMMSMANWRNLITRRMRRFNMTEEQAIATPTLS